MRIKRTYIKNRFGEKLETHIKWDGKKNICPTVLFISGFGQDLHEDSNSFDEIAEKLVEVGFLTIQFSFAGRGKSQGDYSETSVSKQAKEITDVLADLNKLKRVDSQKIGAIAQSMGVPAVIQALPLTVQSLVFICGVAEPYRSLSKVFQERGVAINFTGITSLPRSDGSFTTVKAHFWSDLKRLDLANKLSKYYHPILAIHGSLDTKVTEKEVRRMIKPHTGKNKLIIFEKGDHGILDVPREVREKFLDQIANWFKSILIK